MTPEDTAAPRRGWRTANLVAQLAFGLLAMTICIPSMQDWPRQFGASQAAVQLTFSGYILTYGCLQLLYGPLSDRWGRKPLLMAGLVLSCLGSLLAAAAPDLAVLTLARLLQGAGTAAGMVIGRALVQDMFEGRERTRMMAFVGMTMGLCPPAATLLGGQIHVRLGWQANFLVIAGLAVVLFFAAWKGLPARAAHAMPIEPPRSLRSLPPEGAQPALGAARRRSERASAWGELVTGYGRLARVPAFLGYVAVMSMTTATFYTFLGGAPIVLAGYGVTPEHIGWYIMAVPCSYIAGNILTTRLIRLMSDRQLMAAGQAVTVSGLGLLLVLGLAGVPGPLALALPLTLLGIGHGLLAPPTLTGTVGVMPALAGSAAAVGGLMQQLAGAVAGFTVGLVPHQGAVNLALLMLGWAVAGVACQFVLFRWLQARGRQQAQVDAGMPSK